MERKDGGPAFPVPSYVNVEGVTYESEPQGMTLRDYFAAHLAGCIYVAACRSYDTDQRVESVTNREIAIDAYEIADAMLRARKQE